MSARLYLVAYDIACPRRWRAAVKAVRRLCRRGQLSVFVCRATPARIAVLEKELNRVMHPRDDRLIVLDLGPAHSAGAQLKAVNPLSDIRELGAVIL